MVLLDAQSREAALSRQQVYAVTLLTGRILEGIGVWDRILPRINTFRQIRLSDGDRPADVRFLPQDLNLDRLGYVAEHTPLLQGLREFLDKSDTVCCIESAQVEEIDYGRDEATVTYHHQGQTRQLQASWWWRRMGGDRRCGRRRESLPGAGNTGNLVSRSR